MGVSSITNEPERGKEAPAAKIASLTASEQNILISACPGPLWEALLWQDISSRP